MSPSPPTPPLRDAALAPGEPGLTAALRTAARDQDRMLEAQGLEIWIGAEPTLTDPRLETPEWLYAALGPTKESRARELSAWLGADGVILRTLGRQYPGEPLPRWNIGIYRSRDGQSVWEGPPDPILGGRGCDSALLEPFWERLHHELEAAHWPVIAFRSDQAPKLRLVFCTDGQKLPCDPGVDHRLHRPSIHGQAIPDSGLRDALAAGGLFLLTLDLWREGEETFFCLELPGLRTPSLLNALLGHIGRSARSLELPSLILRGFPPPVNRTVSWTTITPDPAVIEINQAPSTSLEEFYEQNRRLLSDAHACGLASHRMHYNGAESDSGGGGQLTLGGPSPEASPFFIEPRLLPRMIRYLNRHPALSYWLAPANVGPWSQAPRPDEGIADLFQELEVALEEVDRRRFPDPELIWRSLSPFLTDAAGNTHRSELNVEKLWNPYLPGRGQLGVVEFRAFRMPTSAEDFTALAALIRAIAARLMQTPYQEPLITWGRELHDRFALPFFLRQDLRCVLDDLEHQGLGLPQLFRDRLLDDRSRLITKARAADLEVRLTQALEFWPLIGDATAAQPSDSRLMDASTSRIELSVGGEPGYLKLWDLRVNGYRAPLLTETSDQGLTRLTGVRYRSFLPYQGLHPAMKPQLPIELVLSNRTSGQALVLELHEWRPDGAAYPGLPATLEEARARRAERVVCRSTSVGSLDDPRDAPDAAFSPYCFDLRRV